MRSLLTAVLGLSLVSPIVVGCGDQAVEHEKSTSTNPLTGNTTTKDNTTYQRSDGSTYQESSKRTVDH